ncbi:MAG TPA: hypothetical protein VG538_05790 [Vicinamibacterales bacterium]|jgi:hypothetical protein|nr:hypothetical protein [Vicinamibacterales bacterium]
MSEDELPYTKRFGPNYIEALACIDTLVQDLAKILRLYHAHLPKSLVGEADDLVAIITTLFSAMTQRAVDIQDAWNAVRDDEANSTALNKWLDRVFAANFNYEGKSELYRHFLKRIIQEEEEDA